MKILNLGNRIVNTYLVELEVGWLLIDTGYAESFNAFLSKLKKHNINLADIKYVFLTHAHDDHAGFLNNLLVCCKAKVLLHEKAVNGLKQGQNSFNGGCTGKTALGFCKIMKLFGKGEHRFPPVDDQHNNRYIVLNSNIKAVIEQELSVIIIETPGHTSCSISLLLKDGLLFCGDAAMNGFPSMHRTTIWAENMEAYAASWEQIISLNPSLIYPGHGSSFPVTDLRRYLTKLKKKTLYPLT